MIESAFKNYPPAKRISLFLQITKNVTMWVDNRREQRICRDPMNRTDNIFEGKIGEGRLRCKCISVTDQWK